MCVALVGSSWLLGMVCGVAAVTVPTFSSWWPLGGGVGVLSSHCGQSSFEHF